MTKTNCKGRCIRIPICFGVGGPLVREPVLVLAGTPRVGGPIVLEHTNPFWSVLHIYNIDRGMGFYPIPFFNYLLSVNSY